MFAELMIILLVACICAVLLHLVGVLVDHIIPHAVDLLDYQRNKKDYQLYLRDYLRWEEAKQTQIFRCDHCAYRERAKEREVHPFDE